MKARDALSRLAEITGSQWGLLTTAQAKEVGVTRLDLSRLESAGDLERIAHGAYKDAGAPTGEFLDLQVAWLLADPARRADDRLNDGPSGAVVMGESATTLHGIGDLRAQSAEFAVPSRRQTSRAGVTFRTRALDRADVTIREGLPVTTVERTLADLIELNGDLSLVADVLASAVSQRRVDLTRLAELLAPLARRHGRRAGDGRGMLDDLLTTAGIDERAVARRIADSTTLGAMVTADFVEKLGHMKVDELVMTPALRETLQRLDRMLAESLRPVLDVMNSTPIVSAQQAESLAKSLSSNIDWDPVIASLEGRRRPVEAGR